jgi:hypothetical protein
MPSSPKAQVPMPIGGSKLQRAEDKQKFEFKQIPVQPPPTSLSIDS